MVSSASLVFLVLCKSESWIFAGIYHMTYLCPMDDQLHSKLRMKEC